VPEQTCAPATVAVGCHQNGCYHLRSQKSMHLLAESYSESTAGFIFHKGIRVYSKKRWGRRHSFLPLRCTLPSQVVTLSSNTFLSLYKQCWVSRCTERRDFGLQMACFTDDRIQKFALKPPLIIKTGVGVGRRNNSIMGSLPCPSYLV